MTLYKIIVEAPISVIANYANVSVVVDPNGTNRYRLTIKEVRKLDGEWIEPFPSAGQDEPASNADRIQLLFDGLARVEGRLAKFDEEAALNLVATDARLDRLSGMIANCATVDVDLAQVHNRINRLSEPRGEAADIRRRLAVLAAMAKVLES